MANKEYIDRAATFRDEDFKIEVTTLAPLNEIKKGNLVETGKEVASKQYGSDNIRSDELVEGMTIAAEDNVVEISGNEHGE